MDEAQIQNSAELRDVYGAFPSGVAAVCAMSGAERVGMAVSTFTPVSLDPPLISLCIQRSSSTWPRLRNASSLGVSVLSADHEGAARQLSLKAGDRFAGVATTITPSGAIHLDQACAWFECAIENEVEAGDHLIVVLRIARGGRRNPSDPLVFHGSKFRRLEVA